jgi:hypothetical protein
MTMFNNERKSGNAQAGDRKPVTKPGQLLQKFCIAAEKATIDVDIAIPRVV